MVSTMAMLVHDNPASDSTVLCMATAMTLSVASKLSNRLINGLKHLERVFNSNDISCFDGYMNFK